MIIIRAIHDNNDNNNRRALLNTHKPIDKLLSEIISNEKFLYFCQFPLSSNLSIMTLYIIKTVFIYMFCSVSILLISQSMI